MVQMTTHCSVLALRIPGTGEPDGLPSMGSHRVGHDWSDLAAAAAAVYICQCYSQFVPPSLSPALTTSMFNFFYYSLNILFWCLELLMQLFRARCSGPPVPKKQIKGKKNLFILCDLMHRWKNLTQNNRSWSLINHVLVSFSTSTSRHLQFFQVSASSSSVVLTLQLQRCICPKSVKKTITFLSS